MEALGLNGRVFAPASRRGADGKREGMGLFTSRKEVVKREIAAEFAGGPVRTPEGLTVIVSTMDGWTVIYDIDSPEEGPPPLFFGPRKVSRIGIPYTAREEFSWDIRRRRLVGDRIYERRTKWTAKEGPSWEEEFEQIQQRLKPPAIDFGFGDFDYEFTIETSDEAKFRELVEPRELRQLMQEQPTIRLRTEHDEKGWMASLVPELHVDVASLFFQDRALLREPDDIATVHALLLATMDRLVAVGTASPKPPRIFD